MTAPEPITPTPTTGKVMTWWGTGITIPTSGAPEPITPTPATGKVMTWRWGPDGAGWSVGFIRIGS